MNALSKNTEIYGNDNYLSLKCLFKVLAYIQVCRVIQFLSDF